MALEKLLGYFLSLVYSEKVFKQNRWRVTFRVGVTNYIRIKAFTITLQLTINIKNS